MKMDKITLGSIIFISAVSILGVSVLINSASAHSDPDELRFFEKDFCAGEDTILGDRTYTDGHELSYDSSGCPVSTIVIHNWDNITIGQKTIINTRMTTEGYNDVTAQLLSQ